MAARGSDPRRHSAVPLGIRVTQADRRRSGSGSLGAPAATGSRRSIRRFGVGCLTIAMVLPALAGCVVRPAGAGSGQDRVPSSAATGPTPDPGPQPASTPRPHPAPDGSTAPGPSTASPVPPVDPTPPPIVPDPVTPDPSTTPLPPPPPVDPPPVEPFDPDPETLFVSAVALTSSTGMISDIRIGRSLAEVVADWPGELVPFDVAYAGCDWYQFSPVADLSAVFDRGRLVAVVVGNHGIRTMGYNGWTEHGARVDNSSAEVEAAHPTLLRLDDPDDPNRWYLSAPYQTDAAMSLTFELAGRTVVNYRAGYREYAEDPYVCSN